MNARSAISTMLILGALVGSAGGADPANRAGHGPRQHCHPPAVCQCCDDYCRKPLPNFPCSLPKHCDDYCPKPLPPVPCGGCKQDDCYCSKPLPCISPLRCEFLRCGLPELCWPLPGCGIYPAPTLRR